MPDEIQEIRKRLRAAGVAPYRIRQIIEARQREIKQPERLGKLGKLPHGLSDPPLLLRAAKQAIASATAPLSIFGVEYDPRLAEPETRTEKMFQALGGIAGTVASFIPIGRAVGGATVLAKGGQVLLGGTGALGRSAKYVSAISKISTKYGPKAARIADLGARNIFTFGAHGQLSLPLAAGVGDRARSLAADTIMGTLFTGAGALREIGRAGKYLEPFALFGIGAGGDLGMQEMPAEDRIIHGLSLMGFHYARQGLDRIGIRSKQITALNKLGYSIKDAIKMVDSTTPKIEEGINQALKEEFKTGVPFRKKTTGEVVWGKMAEDGKIVEYIDPASTELVLKPSRMPYESFSKSYERVAGVEQVPIRGPGEIEAGKRIVWVNKSGRRVRKVGRTLQKGGGFKVTYVDVKTGRRGAMPEKIFNKAYRQAEGFRALAFGLPAKEPIERYSTKQKAARALVGGERVPESIIARYGLEAEAETMAGIREAAAQGKPFTVEDNSVYTAVYTRSISKDIDVMPSSQHRGYAKALERAHGLDKHPKDIVAKTKVFVTGVESTTKMKKGQLIQWIGFLSAPESKQIKSHKVDQADVYSPLFRRLSPQNKARLEVVNKNLNWLKREVLPSSKAVESLGGRAAKEAARLLEQMPRDRVMTQGRHSVVKLDLHRAGLSRKEYEGVMGVIDPKFEDFIPESLKEKIRTDKRLLSKIRDIHLSQAEPHFREMVRNKIVVRRYDAKGRHDEPLEDHHVSNFVHYHLTREAAIEWGLTSGDFYRYVIKRIMDQKRIPREAAIAQLSEALRWQTGTVKGAIFVREANLDPVVAFDKNGNPIDLVKGKGKKKTKAKLASTGEELGYNVKTGQTIVDANGETVRINRAFPVYETNYDKAMAYYYSRTGQHLAIIKNFGAKPEKTIGRLLIEIGEETGNRKGEVRWAEKIFDMQVMGTAYDETIQNAARGLVGISASMGLSGPFSGVKNFFLGQVQNALTFGLRNMSSSYYEILSTENGLKEAIRTAYRIGAAEAGSRTLAATIGKKWYAQPAEWWMKPTEIANRVSSVIIGPYFAENAWRVLRGEISPRAAGMSKAYAMRVLEKTYEFDVGKLLERDNVKFTPAEIEKIQMISHEVTQGFPDPAHMPRLLGSTLGKSFTLFYRIAYRITENVWRNAMRPMVEDGDMMPMMRYVAASTLAGWGLSAMYNAVLGREANEFKDSFQRWWEYFVRAEGLALFSNAFDEYGTAFNSYMPVVMRPLRSLTLDLGQAVMGKKTWKQWGFDAAKDNVVLYNHIHQVYRRTAQPHVDEFKDIRKKQRDFETTYLKAPKKTRRYEPDVRTPYYRSIRDSFYSSASQDDKGRAYWAAVNYVAHQLVIQTAGRYSNSGAKARAKAIVKGILSDMKPLSLSKTKQKGEKYSRYHHFMRAASPKTKARVRALEKIYNKKLHEYYKAVRMTRSKYGKGY